MSTINPPYPSTDLADRTAAWDCYSSTTGYVLAALGYEHRILGAEWGYHRPDPATEISDPTHRVVLPRRTRRGIGDLVHYWHGITERIDRHADVERAHAYLADQLSDGRPVILRTDTFHLPHATLYRRMHHPHRVVATGWCAEAVHLTDAYRGSRFSGWLARPTVDRTLDCSEVHTFDGFGPDVVTLTLLPAAVPAALDPETMRAEILANLDHYFRSPDGACPGRLVLDEFVDSLFTLSDGTERMSPKTALLLLTFLGECSSQRTLNARFLELAGGTWTPVEAFASAFDDMAAAWLRLRNDLFIAHSRDRPVATYLPPLIARLRALSATETEVFAGLDRCF